MTKIPQTEEELEKHLEEQIKFLKLSTESYDKGFKEKTKNPPELPREKIKK